MEVCACLRHNLLLHICKRRILRLVTVPKPSQEPKVFVPEDADNVRKKRHDINPRLHDSLLNPYINFFYEFFFKRGCWVDVIFIRYNPWAVVKNLFFIHLRSTKNLFSMEKNWSRLLSSISREFYRKWLRANPLISASTKSICLNFLTLKTYLRYSWGFQWSYKRKRCSSKLDDKFWIELLGKSEIRFSFSWRKSSTYTSFLDSSEESKDSLRPAQRLSTIATLWL